MNIEEIRTFALGFEGVTEELPFGPDNLVFKVKGKMFLLADLNSVPLRINVKCDPALAIELRAEFPEEVLPGYHMNKKHWNTVIAESSLTTAQIEKMILDSYNLVVPGKKRKL